MPNRRDVLAGAAALAAGVLVGPRDAAAQALAPVRIGAAPVEPQAQIYYAIDKGFLAKNGLDPQFTTMRNGSVTIEAVLSGQVDIGAANTISSTARPSASPRLQASTCSPSCRISTRTAATTRA
jgi:ABC-type nitrate/sulfonate/bicarbonate transport system substrate-binding protein